MRSSRRIRLILWLFALPILPPAALVVPVEASAQARLKPKALRQIRALLAEKAERTTAERKVSSRLLHTARMRRGREIAAGIHQLRTGVELEPGGTLRVDLDARVTPALLARIEAVGGEVLGAWPGQRSVRARIPVEACESVAELPEVRGLRPADLAFTHADTSEGVEAHQMDLLRNLYGVDGTGIRVGVLSDGVDSLASLVSSGDLPPVTVLPSEAGTGSEGTAMLEIVHDLAPGAELYFATAFNGKASFADNIRALRDAGADVIVDDVRYFSEAIFQDGVVAAAVDDVAADGVLYFSAAGNEGNLDSGTGGVWEGDFADSGTLRQGSAAHDFGASVVGNGVEKDSPFVFMLQWADPQGGSPNDYDLFLLDPEMSSVIASSTDEQSGTQSPYELIDSRVVNDVENKLVVVLYAGEPRTLHLNAFRGELEMATAGQIAGHTAAAGAVSVAAVDVRLASGPGGSFSASEWVQSYSSDGPRRIFYLADGTPLSASLLSDGGYQRAKPELAAADCVDTATPGFNIFCGTSAAAPHAAGIAAVLLEMAEARGRRPEDVLDAMLATGLDIEAPGPDDLAGHGIVDALASAQAVRALLPDLPSLRPPQLALLALVLACGGSLGIRWRGAQSEKRCRRSPSSRQTAP